MSENKVTEAEDLGQDTEVKNVPVNEPKGKAIIEKEHVVYARILDFSALKGASKATKQEQWQVTIPRNEKNAAEGKVRIRKVETAKGHVRYEFTTKITTPSGDKLESTIEADATLLNMFKFLADNGMVKHRYEFPTDNGLTWEVDVYPDGKGGYCQWCRMEVEVPDKEAPLPEFPFKVEEAILPPGLEQKLSPEEREAKVRQLMDSIFLRENEYLGKVVTNQVAEGSTTNVEEAPSESEPTPVETDNPTTETEVTADDITSNKEEAENTEEKAKEVEDQQNKEDQDTLTGETEPDTNEESETKVDDKVESSSEGEVATESLTEDILRQAYQSGISSLLALEEIKECLDGPTSNHVYQGVFDDVRKSLGLESVEVSVPAVQDTMAEVELAMAKVGSRLGIEPKEDSRSLEQDPLEQSIKDTVETVTEINETGEPV